MSMAIHIPQFEGPMGLLLYLIRKEEMDIFDINIYLITSQYLEYIKKMKQFDLEVAGDFIAMAATLIQIKSKMLLPNYSEEGEEEELVDPRKELVQKLIEYQRYQEAAKKIYDRPLLNRDIWRRGKSEFFINDEEGEIIVDEGGLFSMIALYRGAIRKMKKTVHTVANKTKSIAARILEIKDRLVVGQKVLMHDLLNSVDDFKNELLVTFLSVLELGKIGYVSVYQSENYGDIYLTAKRSIEGNVVERVEEYDAIDSENIAKNIMDKAQEESVVEVQFDDSVEEVSDEDFVAHSEDNLDLLASDDEIAAAEVELDINNHPIQSELEVNSHVELTIVKDEVVENNDNSLPFKGDEPDVEDLVNRAPRELEVVAVSEAEDRIVVENKVEETNESTEEKIVNEEIIITSDDTKREDGEFS